MRASPGVEILRDGAGKPYGVSLAPDFVAEHECSTRGIDAVLGVGERPCGPGLPRRTATRGAKDRLVCRNPADTDGERADPWGPSGCAVLGLCRVEALGNPRGVDSFLETMAEALAYAKDGRTYVVEGEWDGNGFALYAQGGEATTVLGILRDALSTGDAAVWIDRPDRRRLKRRLVVAVASRVPEETRARLEAQDVDAENLQREASATGIRARIDAMGHVRGPSEWSHRFGYFALTPEWCGNVNLGRRPTAHRVAFWLNPLDQKSFKAGWYTVEDLDAWLQDKGPVVKPLVDTEIPPGAR